MAEANDNKRVENCNDTGARRESIHNSPSPCAAMRSQQRRAAIQTVSPAAVRWAYAACQWYWLRLRTPVSVDY